MPHLHVIAGSGATAARRRDTTMLTTSKIALSLALVLTMASAAVAAPKRPIHHHSATEVQRRASAGREGYRAFGSATFGYTPTHGDLCSFANGVSIYTQAGC